jgi:hypothetical protein
MRQRLLSALACIAIVLVGAAGPGRANADTPTPTPAPALTAQQIITRMQAAQQQENTEHVDLTVRVSSARKLRLALHEIADISLHPQLVSEVDSIKGNLGPPFPRSTQIRTLIVGNRAAERFGKRSWTCSGAQSAFNEVVDLLKQLHPQLHGAQDLGTATIAGMAVWHIRATASVSSMGKTFIAPIDLYIAQAGFTLVQEHSTQTLHSSGMTLHETVNASFSRYGEPVNVVLPSICTAPLVFSIQRVALEPANAKPDFSLKRPSPSHVPRGKEIQIAVYVLYRTVRAPAMLYERERVWRNGKPVFGSWNHDKVKPGDRGSQEWFYDSFTPWHPGRFRFTATVWSGRLVRHKTIWFSVTP